MSAKYLLRNTAYALLARNAITPLPGAWISPVTFFSGWLTSELTPHCMVVVAIDSLQHFLPSKELHWSDWAGLAFAGGSLAALTNSVWISLQADPAINTVVDEVIRKNPLPDSGAQEQLVGSTAGAERAPWWGEHLTLTQLIWPFSGHHKDVVRHKNLHYDEGGYRNAIDVYHRKDKPSGAPLLLHVHGGGWAVGSKDDQGFALMNSMAARGWVCASVNYPLAPKNRWPQQLYSVKKAIAWLHEHAETYGGDPSFFAITGGSAGGQLASLAALTQNTPDLQPGFETSDTTIDACLAMYAISDLDASSGLDNSVKRRATLAWLLLDPEKRTAHALSSASPLTLVHPDAPPFLIVHGVNDSLVPISEARRFVDALRAVSHDIVAFAEIPGAQHAFDIFPSIRSAAVRGGCEKFLLWAAARKRVSALDHAGRL